ncbi:uncharacterized protein LOC130801019 [Amaranthus tricolor]|uniref:uncharacterized protein LOC130801019 n=1 Tax=Amaranthus tricolor TaxID=29722 RepID=UPI0025892DF1|nr:uncharacterized protein LOC130801019 [Amaranthus tricolor]
MDTSEWDSLEQPSISTYYISTFRSHIKFGFKNMSSDDSSNSSNSSSNSENSQTQRYERRRQANRQFDRMMDEVFMSNPVEVYQMFNQVPRPPRVPVPRDREDGHSRLWNDYFIDHPVFPPQFIRQRFRMNKHIFLRIKQTLEERHPFFQQRQDATGRFGAFALQKCTAAMRLIAYGTSADSVDDYIQISASLARDSLQHFVEGIVSYFSDEYLRKPNEEDIVRLLRIGESRGFPGMLGSIDCMHWRLKNCPLRLKGMFSGRPGKPTLILEAVASYDLWICHAFFGTPGSRNDINVLDRSPLFNDVFEGCAPSFNYVVNGHTYNMGYYLTDGIYPTWAAFIPTISLPQNEKEGLFAKVQEAKRKDVERAFRVLQARFAIIRIPALARDVSILGKIMIACIIMHNMIVEDERDTYKTYYDPNEYDQATNASSSNENNEEPFQFQNSNNRIASLETYMSNRARVRDEAMHKALKKDLVEHMWLKFGVQSRDNNMH